MATKIRMWLLACLATFGLATGAQAAIIDLNPFAQSVSEGDLLMMTLDIGFDVPTIGGTLDIFYDSDLLRFIGFDFDPLFLADVADPDFSLEPENCFMDGSAYGGCSVGDGELNALTFGNFDGISGIHTAGVLVFEALMPGTATVWMADNDIPSEGEGFLTLGGDPIPVIYNSAQVFIEPVPLPAAVWLLLPALGAIGAFGRRT